MHWFIPKLHEKRSQLLFDFNISYILRGTILNLSILFLLFWNLTGSGPTGADEIKSHSFFDGIDWVKLTNKEVGAPFKPTIRHPLDTSNFSDEFTKQSVSDSPVKPPVNHERLFRGKMKRRINRIQCAYEFFFFLIQGFSYVSPELMSTKPVEKPVVMTGPPKLEEVIKYNSEVCD